MRARTKVAVLAATALAVGALPASPSLANLTGSTFEGNDGNQIVNTVGNLDWQNVPGRVVGNDLPTGSTDNSFGQGTKEQSPNVSVVSGQIPNSKADIGQFAVASQFANGQNFLYLAWTRNNTSGSTNFDFEINRAQQPPLLTPGAAVLNRTAGDLLVTYDFDGGSQETSIGLLRWLTVGPASNCFDGANSLPCWGNRQDLIALGEAEAAVNTTAIANTFGAPGPATIEPFRFGETAINLTAAGVFPPGTCTGFGSAFVKSRSASSFPAEVKDFIAPQPVNISNCGTIVIDKVTVPSPDPTNTAFSFSLAKAGVLDKQFTLTNAQAPNVTDNVPVGNGYVAAETVPDGWALTSATCVDTVGANSPVTNIDVAPGETVTCTFTNTLQQGAILVTKTRKHAAGGGTVAHPGVTFTVNGVSKVTNAQGQACFDGLTFGAAGTSYNVTETLPAGYVADDGLVKSVLVNNTATCTATPYAGETVSFSNTPLTNLSVAVDSQVNGGTASTIVCTAPGGGTVASGSTGANGDGSASALNLEPGIYTCTVNIDP